MPTFSSLVSVNAILHCKRDFTDAVRLLSWGNCPGLSAAAAAKSLQSCPTLCDPIDGSPPGSSVPGILQARIMQWVAIPFSKGSSPFRDQMGSPALWAGSLPSELPGQPFYI